jgi:hypothetical protein
MVISIILSFLCGMDVRHRITLNLTTHGRRSRMRTGLLAKQVWGLSV